MPRKILFFCLFFISFNCFAQLSESNVNLLRTELSIHVNELRLSKGLPTLGFNNILRLAGENHSDYLLNIGKLKHRQKENPEFYSPTDRVVYYGGGHFELVGENILKTKPYKNLLDEGMLKQAARTMFEAWKNSPRHYENLINPNYQLADYGFKWDDNLQVIYAVQVFGKEGFEIKGQLSPNAFGLKDDSADCHDNFYKIRNIVASLGNDFRIEGNEVKFYYHSNYYFNRIFSGKQDGIAVDLLFRDQFVCESDNQLDASPIYDGVLLEPIYRKELLSKNTAQNKHRIITTVGIIPDSLVGRIMGYSIVLIKDGKKCQYLVPGPLPSKPYRLRPIKPQLQNPENIELDYKGISQIQQLHYNFETNQIRPVEFPSIQHYPKAIHSVEIHSYSSVEGKTESNIKLHGDRAKTIKKHLKEQLDIDAASIKVHAKENWEKMHFQLRYLFKDELTELPKDSLKQFIAEKKALPSWDDLLFEQRQSTAVIYYYDELSTDADGASLASLNLRTAIVNNNLKLANKAIFELYKESLNWQEIIYEPSIFEALKTHPELVQNAAALLSKTYQNDLHKITEFLDSWIPREEELSFESKRNLLHLYSLTAHRLLRLWDLPSQSLSNIIHPNRIKKFRNKNIEEELELNLQLTFLNYFGQINDGTNIQKSFDFVTRFFKNNALNLEDQLDLALFFNHWSTYDACIELLRPRFMTNELDEKGLFILLETLSFYQTKKNIRLFESVYLKTLEVNPERWCIWVDDNFQILRNQSIKKLYCKKCQDLLDLGMNSE